jgi:hypothetical protein
MTHVSPEIIVLVIGVLSALMGLQNAPDFMRKKRFYIILFFVGILTALAANSLASKVRLSRKMLRSIAGGIQYSVPILTFEARLSLATIMCCSRPMPNLPACQIKLLLLLSDLSSVAAT